MSTIYYPIYYLYKIHPTKCWFHVTKEGWKKRETE